MASPRRFPHTSGEKNEVNNHKYPPEGVLNVMPLNSMPYIGPPLQNSEPAAMTIEVDAEPVHTGPAVVYLSSCPGKEELDKIVASTKFGVGLTGAAATGKVGPTVGLVDIGECEDSYLFRVSLPGVARDESKFHFDIKPDGKIVIKGVTTTGEKIVCKYSQVFEMKTQNLCPPGHFTITFHLPGPVNCDEVSVSYGTDGILQGTAQKR